MEKTAIVDIGCLDPIRDRDAAQPESSSPPLGIEEIPHIISNESLPTTLNVVACPEVRHTHTISNCSQT